MVKMLNYVMFFFNSKILKSWTRAEEWGIQIKDTFSTPNIL